MACYQQPGDFLTYYEIDPAVKRIASDPRYFTFLQQCGSAVQTVLGDARLKLRAAPDGSYDLIVLDAFSGDRIPMHLMTREALALYIRKLAPGGILAFHISNLYLQLAPTLSALAQDAGMLCLVTERNSISQSEADAGKLPSTWVVMARSRTDLGALETDARWGSVAVPLGTQVWTDDYSNLLRLIKWH
jgi:spermidine synthase